MNFESIDHIFAENDRVHEELKRVVANISDETAGTLAGEEKWTIAQVVEHIAMVDEGVSKICSKLLSKTRETGALASGSVNISDRFKRGSAEVDHIKVEAPELVRPTGNIPLSDSLIRMDENRRRLREIQPLFETYDGDTEKFPHPFLGEMSAVEWLIMKGGHEARHTRQIENILEKLG
jgi:hypothetical protein